MRQALAIFGAACLGVAMMHGTPAQATTATDEAEIRALLNDGCQTFINGDAEHSVDLYLNTPDFLVYDVAPPRQKTHDQVVAFNKALIDATVGKPTCVYEEIHPVILDDNFAYSMAILHTTGKTKTGSYDFRERSTDIYKRVNGKWRVIHEHNSVPVDVMTGKADMQSKP